MDVSADFVIQQLRAKGNDTVLRINTEDLPVKESSVRLPDFSYSVSSKEGKSNLVNDLKSVWFRRPGRPFDFQQKENTVSTQVKDYARNQWRSFIEGLTNIENVLWINNPSKNQIAENKIRQLKIASELGMKIPKTCITSSKSEAIDFYKSCDGNIIAKALDSPLIEYPESDYFIFTQAVDSLIDYPESEFALSPTIFQERISPKIDYRVTVIGDHCFAARIEYRVNNNLSNIDWRVEKKNVGFVRSDLPQDIIDKCIQLVKLHGLVFGAIDLVKSNDNFYFLEINPNGEWGWLQKQNLPIAETIADYLLRGNGEHKN
jgi:glutathione synthase/RimK-type ligase-like ATP-grasp enzyme